MIPQVDYWLRDAMFVMQGRMEDAQRAASGGGPVVTLNPGEAEEMLRQANDVLSRLRALKGRVGALETLAAPAVDEASVNYNKKITRDDGAPGTFAQGVSQVSAEVQYLEALVDKLLTALGRTKQQDEDSGVVINKEASDGEGTFG